MSRAVRRRADVSRTKRPTLARARREHPETISTGDSAIPRHSLVCAGRWLHCTRKQRKLVPATALPERRLSAKIIMAGVDVSAAEIGMICYSEESATDYAKSVGLLADAATAVQAVDTCALGKEGCPGHAYETTWTDKRRLTQRGFRCNSCKRKRVGENSVVNGVVLSRKEKTGGAEGLFQRHSMLKKRGLMLIWAWANGKSTEECTLAASLSRATVIRVLSYLREVCYEVLISAPPLGGAGVIVEVRGLQLSQGCFLLAVRTSGEHTVCRVFRVPRATRGCLVGQLQRSVQPGTTLATPPAEEWASLVRGAKTYGHTDVKGHDFLAETVKAIRVRTMGVPHKDVVYHGAELWWREDTAASSC